MPHHGYARKSKAPTWQCMVKNHLFAYASLHLSHWPVSAQQVRKFELTPADTCLVIASDGVWEHLSNDAVRTRCIVTRSTSMHESCVECFLKIANKTLMMIYDWSTWLQELSILARHVACISSKSSVHIVLGRELLEYRLQVACNLVTCWYEPGIILHVTHILGKRLLASYMYARDTFSTQCDTVYIDRSRSRWTDSLQCRKRAMRK